MTPTSAPVPAHVRQLLERVRVVEDMLRRPACDCCFETVQQMRDAADLLLEARRFCGGTDTRPAPTTVKRG